MIKERGFLWVNRLRLVFVIAVLAGTSAALYAGKQGRIDLSTMVTPIYAVEGDAFVGHNGDRYSNRPLYCNHVYAIVLAGDKPTGILGKLANIYGNLMFALVRDGHGVWLQNASDISSKYRPGRMEWTVKDQTWGSTAVHLEMAPSAQGPGMVAQLRVLNARPGDSVVWASGGATVQKASILWVYDQTSLKSGLETRGFVPDDCENNHVDVNGNTWVVQAGDAKHSAAAKGVCSAATQVRIGTPRPGKIRSHCWRATAHIPRLSADRSPWLRIRTSAGVCSARMPGPASLPLTNLPQGWSAEIDRKSRGCGYARYLAQCRRRRFVNRGGRLLSRRRLHPLGHALVDGAAGLADGLRRNGVRLARSGEG